MSILDYKRDTLSPMIWDTTDKLKPGIKDYIFKSLELFFNSKDILGATEFITELYVASSLATFYYTETSDLDIKVLIDIPKFKEYNEKYRNVSDDLIIKELIDTGRESSWLTSVIPGTTHILDIYFISELDFSEERLIRYDSLYSVTKDAWVKYPKSLEIDEDPNFVLNRAKSKAKIFMDKLDSNFAEAKRDTIDFNILMDFLKSLDEDDLQKYYSEIMKSLGKINDSVEELVNDRELFKAMRKGSFNRKNLNQEFEKKMESINYSDGNLVYKILQRYGYLRILYELSQLFEDRKISLNEVDEVSSILT